MKYKISDLAKVLGVTTNTLRRYENNGYLIPERDESKYHWYRAKDIQRIAAVRLYRKCKFTHPEIMEMLNSSSDNVTEICTQHLNAIDAEMERLKYLRHWLKDNIKLMNTLKETGTGFVTMDNPAMKYVLYDKNGELLTEKERLNTINTFMYHVHEVQMIRIIKKSDTGNINPDVYNGWAMKVMDIERLGLQDIITEDNPFIENYPTRKCLYSVLEYPADCNEDDPRKIQAQKELAQRAKIYMDEHNIKLDSDIMAVVVNVIGNMTGLLYCMPIKE